MDRKLSRGSDESDDKVARELLRHTAERVPKYEWLTKKPLSGG